MTTPAQFVPVSQLARSARSDEVVAKHKKYLWPSVTNYFQQPVVADRGEMQYLWDLDGNKYLDFFGGILTGCGPSFGHARSLAAPGPALPPAGPLTPQHASDSCTPASPGGIR